MILNGLYIGFFGSLDYWVNIYPILPVYLFFPLGFFQFLANRDAICWNLITYRCTYIVCLILFIAPFWSLTRSPMIEWWNVVDDCVILWSDLVGLPTPIVTERMCPRSWRRFNPVILIVLWSVLPCFCEWNPFHFTKLFLRAGEIRLFEIIWSGFNPFLASKIPEAETTAVLRFERAYTTEEPSRFRTGDLTLQIGDIPT